MDFIETFGYEKDFKPFYGKVFGTVVSGSGDGFQHIHGTNYNFATMWDSRFRHSATLKVQHRAETKY